MTSTADIVQIFLKRIGDGDVEGIEKLFADDIDWYAPGEPHLPWAGARSRGSEVPDFFRQLGGACVAEDSHVTVGHILVEGNDAVVFGTYHRTFARNGRSFDTPEAMHLRVVDGKIVRMHLYGDTGRVQDAWFDR